MKLILNDPSEKFWNQPIFIIFLHALHRLCDALDCYEEFTDVFMEDTLMICIVYNYDEEKLDEAHLKKLQFNIWDNMTQCIDRLV